MITPQHLEIYIYDKSTDEPVNGISVLIKFAYHNTKNPFYLVLNNSDNNGKIHLSRDDIIAEIRKVMSTCIMDYNYPEKQVIPKITIIVPGTRDIKNTIEYMTSWKSVYTKEEVEQLKACRNHLYEPQTVDIDYTGEEMLNIKIGLGSRTSE